MKQRLVGALVLLSGGVVLWSLLFTGPAAYKVSRSSQLPPPPVIAEVDDIVPQKPADIPLPEPLEVKEADIQPLDAETVPAAEPDKKVGESTAGDQLASTSSEDSGKASPEEEEAPEVPDENGDKPSLDAETNVPKGWVLQVASFVQKNNAEKLKEKLQDKKYKAYVQKVTVASGDRYRVMVGPSLNKSRAQQDQQDIEKQFSLKPLLQRFQR